MREPVAVPVHPGALLGLGGVARQSHLPAYLGYPQVRQRLQLVAAWDENPGAPPTDGVPLVRTRTQLTELGALEFVDICTPTATHFELTQWALAQGWHVLCEKPVATTEADAAAIGQAARRAKRVVVPCHQYRYNPAWRTLKRWLEEGRIGHWHLAQFEVQRLAADAGAVGSGVPWRGRRADGLGGVLIDHGTHLLYQLLDVAGPPASVRAWTGRLRHAAYDVEDTAHLLFDYGDRAATILLTWAGHRRENRIRFTGEDGLIEWSGGLLRWERGGRTETIDFAAQLDKSAYSAWFADLFTAFADALERGDGDGHLDDIHQVAVLLEAAYQAATEPGVLLRPLPRPAAPVRVVA